MRRKEHVIPNNAMMPDVIAAPHDDIMADGHKWLDRVVLEDKTVLADGDVREHCGFCADVRNQGVSLRLKLSAYICPQAIHLPRRHWSKAARAPGWEGGFKLLKRNHWMSLKVWFDG